MLYVVRFSSSLLSFDGFSLKWSFLMMDPYPLLLLLFGTWELRKCCVMHRCCAVSGQQTDTITIVLELSMNETMKSGMVWHSEKYWVYSISVSSLNSLYSVFHPFIAWSLHSGSAFNWVFHQSDYVLANRTVNRGEFPEKNGWPQRDILADTARAIRYSI